MSIVVCKVKSINNFDVHEIRNCKSKFDNLDDTSNDDDDYNSRYYNASNT